MMSKLNIIIIDFLYRCIILIPACVMFINHYYCYEKLPHPQLYRPYNHRLFIL